MPLHWIIDSRAELVSAVAEGECRSPGHGLPAHPVRREGHGLSQAVRRPQRHVVDERAGAARDLVEIRSHHNLGKVGALAVISNPEQTEPFARVLGALALADRPMRLFDNPTRARNWLDAQVA